MAACEHDLDSIGPDQLQEAFGCTQVRFTNCTQVIKEELLDEGGSKL